MELQVEESGPLERKLRIEIPTAEVDAAFDEVYERLRRRAHLKGFRKGKAPRAVLERYFADEVRGDVLDHLVRETLPKAVDEASLALVAPPKVAPGESPRQGAPFAYEARVEIRPVIELKQIRGLPVAEVQLPEAEQDPVEQYLEELRVENAHLHAADPGTSAARGHVAVLEVSAQRDGQPWFERTERQVVLGDESLVPGFDDQLVGMREGDSREFELELPAAPAEPHDHDHGDHDHDHAHAEPHAAPGGAPARASFSVQLRQLKRRELHELDDEFAKDVSDFATLEELRADLRARVEKGREQQRQRQREQAVLNALIDANDFPVPPSLVEEQLHRRIREVFRGLQAPPQEESFRKIVDDLGERLRPHAERDVRAAFLVREVAQKEGIEIRDEEVDAHARELAEERGESAKQMLREARGSELGDALRQHLLERRVFEFLLEHSVPAHA